MRPQQQNRRMRGRNNNNNNQNQNQNRKGPNPLTRSYESNGPDVKIRGSAQQIAEKYMQLARDAHSSGDRVMNENYLQHAEHYNRIIAAAQAQQPQQFNRDSRDDQDDDEDQDNPAPQQSFEPQPQVNDGTGPQPEISGIPAEVALNPEASGEEQPREVRPQVTGGEGEEGAPRRPRRPRPRGRGGDFANREGGAEDGSSAPEGEAAAAEPEMAPEPSDEAA
nr:DUF4167 domain-containing protein [Mesorhizobium sp.]